MPNLSEAEMLEWIANATYQELLYKNRFEPVGSPWFQGKVGDVLLGTLYDKKSKLSPDEQVAASKAVGWGRIGGTDK